MKKQNLGKQFEKDFQASIPKKSMLYRFKDSTGAWGNGPGIDTTILNIAMRERIKQLNPDLDIQKFSFPEFNPEQVNGLGIVEEAKTRFTPRNICDFLVVNYPIAYFLELKSTQQKSLAFSMIRDTQEKEMTKAVDTKGVKAGFVVNFRAVDETYYLPIEKYNEIKALITSKSIPISVFRTDAVLLPQVKKITTWRYDIEPIFTGQNTNLFKLKA